MAEIELNVMIEQCLDPRIDNLDTVRRKVAPWQTRRDQHNAKISFQFTTNDARIKLSRRYPTFKA